MNSIERKLSSAEAGRILDLTPAMVRVLLRAGKLPFISTPLGRLLDADAVEALAAERQRTGHPRRKQGAR